MDQVTLGLDIACEDIAVAVCRENTVTILEEESFCVKREKEVSLNDTIKGILDELKKKSDDQISIKKICITMPGVSETIRNVLVNIFEENGFDEDDILFMEHSNLALVKVYVYFKGMDAKRTIVFDLVDGKNEIYYLNFWKEKDGVYGNVAAELVSDRPMVPVSIEEVVSNTVRLYDPAYVYMVANEVLCEQYGGMLDSISRNSKISASRQMFAEGAALYAGKQKKYDALYFEGEVLFDVAMLTDDGNEESEVKVISAGEQYRTLEHVVRIVSVDSDEIVLLFTNVKNGKTVRRTVDISDFRYGGSMFTELEVHFTCSGINEFEVKVHDVGFNNHQEKTYRVCEELFKF